MDSGSGASATESSANSGAIVEGAIRDASVQAEGDPQEFVPNGGQQQAAPIDQGLSLNQQGQQQQSQEEELQESQEPQELSEQEQLEQAAGDPNTPAWAREKIKQAMGYAGRLKSELETRNSELGELSRKYSVYEGKDVLPQSDIERMRKAEDIVLNLQSFAARPDDIDRIIRDLNPRIAQDYQNQLVWKALEREDGTPDYDNLQAVVDKFSGDPGKVSAKDVLAAISALKEGLISKEDFHSFSSEEEFQSYQRAQALERQLVERESQATENARFLERQTREGELNKVRHSVQSALESRILDSLGKFKLMRVEGEPKAVSDFKEAALDRIRQLVQAAPQSIREFGELSRAMDSLAEARGVDAPSAAGEVRAFQENPAFRQYLNKGMSDLMTQIEKEITQQAYFNKLIALGLEMENSKADRARAVIGSSNQTAGNQGFTVEQLRSMNASQRNNYAAERASAELREILNPSTNRLG